jgi:hypothetical protein
MLPYVMFLKIIQYKKGGTVKIYKAFFLVVLCVLLPYLLAAETMAVLDFKSIGVDEALVDATVTLLRSDIASYKKYTLIEKDKIEKMLGGPTDCADKDCAAEIGDKINAEKVVYGTVSKLGEKYVIAASIVDVASKKLVFQDRISATSAEDLDIVSKRLAKAIVTGKSVEKTAEVGAVIEEETKEPRRRRSFYTVGGKFGWGFPIGSDSYGGTNALMGGDFLYWYETQNVIVEFSFGAYMTPMTTSVSFMEDTTIQEEATIHAMEATYAQLSLLYLFSKQDICPYAGGGIGMKNLWVTQDNPGFFDSYTESAFGMGLTVNGGIIAFRTYDFRVFLDASYSLNLANLERFGGPHHAFKICVGFTYKKEMGGGGCGGGGCGGGGCL